MQARGTQPNYEASIVKLLKDTPKETIYSVTSGDAGYSEAGA